MARNAAATRRSILGASIVEFAQRGFAGARIDTIAEASGVNKRMIYVYFTDKDGLFAAALHHVIDEMVHAVPITENDLPGYAGALFDYLIEHPEALRLSLWRHLERPEGGQEARDLYASKVAAIRSLDVSTSSRIPATDLLVLIQSMASAWLISPTDLLAAASDEPMSTVRLTEHRRSLLHAVSLLTR